MKASSESGECASLISMGDFSVFEAVCRAAMGWVFLVLSWASFFPERRSAPQRCCRETDGKKRAHRRGLRGAGPDDFCNRKPSISVAGGQTCERKKGTLTSWKLTALPELQGLQKRQRS